MSLSARLYDIRSFGQKKILSKISQSTQSLPKISSHEHTIQFSLALFLKFCFVHADVFISVHSLSIRLELNVLFYSMQFLLNV